MSAVEERDRAPDACERFGVAVNSNNLATGERSWAADQIAEVGNACVALRLSAELTSARVAAMRGMEAAERAHQVGLLEAELAPLLWRLRSGGELGFVPHVVTLFGQWLVLRDKFKREEEQWVMPFAGRVVHEMLSMRCQACRGCGQQEKVGNAWVAPRGMKMLAPKFRSCQVCGGGGLGKPLHHERAKALGIAMKDYERGGWERRFRVGQVWLDRISRRLNRPLAILKRRA